MRSVQRLTCAVSGSQVSNNLEECVYGCGVQGLHFSSFIYAADVKTERKNKTNRCLPVQKYAYNQIQNSIMYLILKFVYIIVEVLSYRSDLIKF